MDPNVAIWIAVAVATGCIILRPWKLPEAIWTVAGAVCLVAFGLLSPAQAWRGVARGIDVYCFLVGMMLLAELARLEGFFDWLAARAARAAAGDPKRLFTLIYLVGVVVTVFLSNDATAVVLTPAVAAAARAAGAEKPLPYLLICAMVANAASFVLPISNPANLVIYGSRMPPLAEWLPRYAPASAAAILVTYVVLRATQRASLRAALRIDVVVPALSGAGAAAAAGIGATSVVLMVASAMGWDLGLPTLVAGLATCLVVLVLGRQTPWRFLRGISWGVIPLVAGLFVLVQALGATGVLGVAARRLHDAAAQAPGTTAWACGVGLALLSNLTNNLPAGLVAGGAVQAAQAPALVTRAVLVGVDIGPNLSVAGSLATILWLNALRREGLAVGGWAFLRVGLLVMPPALLLAILVL